MNRDDLLKKLLSRSKRLQHAHFKTATFFEKLNYLFGIPVIILTTLVSATAFSSFNQIKTAIVIASGFAAILSAIQTFIRPSEKFERHKQASAHFFSMQQEIEMYIAKGETDNFEVFVNRINSRMSQLIAEAPIMLGKTYK